MVAGGVSAALVRRGDGELGIVTARDLTSRVVAEGLPADTPVGEVITAPIVAVGTEQTGADVMLAMLDNDVHHVPVLSPRSEVIGVISALDLFADETRTPFVLRREIAEATDKADLGRAADRLRSTVVALHRADLPPAQISEVISVVADALIRRMIELAIASEGAPPTEFAWMALGSHGRREAVPSSDVDSGMAWRDEADAPERYMRAIADDVADCIAVIGWRLDPHGVTASGSFSASSIGDWRRAIETWLANPSDERVLIATSILLDGRTVYGPERELDVKSSFYEAASAPTLLRWMLRLALASKPPTGFMRDIVVEGSGERRGTFDIKHGGLLPIVDLARYAGLRAELRLTSTVERLRAAGEAGTLEPAQARTLEEAYDLFAALRLEHQVRQLESGLEPDDHLDPGDLNSLTRHYLRDAFREVAAVQRSLAGELHWTA
jgi:CBS domain-containing protein